MNWPPGVYLDRREMLALREIAARQTSYNALADSHAGGISGKKRGQGNDFFDLRPYGEGDDIRRIDAAATARSGRPQIRNFHEEKDLTALLIADFRSTMFWGTKTRFRSVAAALALVLFAWQLLESGGRVALLLLKDHELQYFPHLTGERGMLQLISRLESGHENALTHKSNATDTLTLVHALERAEKLAHRGGAVVVATGLDKVGADFVNIVDRLGLSQRLTFLHVCDAVEMLPPKGLFACDFGGKKGKMAGREVHLARYTGKTGNVTRSLASSMAQLVTIDAAAPPKSWLEGLNHGD